MNLLLIDGNSIVYRAYYGTCYSTGLMKNNSGIPVNAILAFHNILKRIIKTYKPTHIMVAFDAGKKTFRHEKLSSYKANRLSTPEDLIIQFPIIKEMLDLFKIPRMEIDKIEADDIIASIATKYNFGKNEIKIISSDKDLLQMVSERISVIIPQNNSKPDLIINNDNFKEIFQYHPNQVVDVKAILGDASDNLIGVKGIGKKGAIKLIEKFKNLETIYKNIDQITGTIKNKLIESKDMAFLCKEITTLKKNISFTKDINYLIYEEKITNDLIIFFKKYNLNSLVKKYSTNSKINNFENLIF